MQGFTSPVVSWRRFSASSAAMRRRRHSPRATARPRTVSHSADPASFARSWIATDAAYRTSATAARFREDVRAFVGQGRAQGKPVAVTEFGCGAHRGAADLAGRDGSNIVWGDDGRAVRPNGDLVRDEDEQADYLRESLDVFTSEGVDAAFVYTFARYDLPHRDDPRLDLDMVSAGVVKVLDDQRVARDRRSRRYPDMPWEPKAAFDALAGCFARDPDHGPPPASGSLVAQRHERIDP